MRLIRRLPKRGFTNPFRSTYQIVNVGDLKNWDKAVVVDVDTLKAKNMVRSVADPVKILGDGVIEHPLTVKVHAISKAAREKIEAAGGTVEVIG